MTDSGEVEVSAYSILIVEDDLSGSHLLSTLLEMEGFRTIEVGDWQDPLSDIERRRPGLVLMDVRLQNSSGFDLLGQIRTHPDPAIAATPVLMMSAEDHRIQSRKAGANGFLSKPYELPVLFESIRRAKEDGQPTN